MVDVPIGQPMRMVTVASPACLKRYGNPKRPEDLITHRCNLRLPTPGGLYPWEFNSDGSEFRVRVQGPLDNEQRDANPGCIFGRGKVAQLSGAHAQEHINSGALQEVLGEWSESFPGYHLYYSTRRQQSAAFGIVLNTLRTVETTS